MGSYPWGIITGLAGAIFLNYTGKALVEWFKVNVLKQKPKDDKK